MKKIAIVLFVASAALAGCSKKNANTTPTSTSAGSASGDMGSAAAPAGGSGDMGGAPAGGSGGM
ncbi:MAG TPA: hypothetical protein VGL61_21875 [Kofleriaceae bacterium]|jgi:hypothetical protein